MAPLPAVVAADLARHLEAVKRQHEGDLQRGAGWVELPVALARKYHTLGASGRGSGYSLRPGPTAILRPASGAAITSTNRYSSVR